MSFLKISDPGKRDSIVKEYLDLKKNIRDNFFSEKTGEQDLQTDLSKFFKPITETQKATAREITEEFKPIKEGIENLPQAITFPAYPSTQASEEDVLTFGKVASNTVKNFLTKDETDKTFGLRDKGGKFYIGDRQVKIKVNDIEVLDNVTGVVDKTYIGTPGLWELIVSPNPKGFTNEDSTNYKDLMIKTNSIYRNNDPTSINPKDNRKGSKWENFIRPIWDDTREEKEWKKGKKGKEGSGVIVIPSNPNTLLERLDLLLASQEAGHTGVRNELVSICDELKRQVF